MFSMVRKIFIMSGRYKPRIVLGIIFQSLKSSCLSIMLLSVLIINRNADNLTWAIIGQAFTAVMLSVVLQFAFKWLVDVTMSATGYDIFKDKRLEIGARLKRAPMGYFTEQNLGNIQASLTTTISALEEYSMMMVSMLLGGVIQAVAIIVLLLFFCPPAALLTLIGLVTGMAALRLVTVQSDKYALEMQLANEDLTGKSLEFIRGVSVLRSFGKDGEGLSDICGTFERKKQSDCSSENGIAWTVVLYQTVFKVTSCIMLLLAPLLYLNGQIGLPICLMLVVSAFMIYSGFETMSNGALLSRVIHAQLKRLEEITNFELIDEDAAEICPEHYDIALEEVMFAYDEKKIIDGISFGIPEKSTCAIIGPSGGGKTTLCRLIARFWDVNGGRITLGGHDVREYTCDSLLANISIVFQNVYLFHDTIAANIRFGKFDATDDEVIEAAKKACCHEFIHALPEGYETMVGEGGHTLSGGEKQRISIARAILKDAPIVILDEATASVDPENESKLLRALDELTTNRTVISIAHRLKTIQGADNIIVLDKGKIAEMGSHSRLMENGGIYYNFVKMREAAATWRV